MLTTQVKITFLKKKHITNVQEKTQIVPKQYKKIYKEIVRKVNEEERGRSKKGQKEGKNSDRGEADKVEKEQIKLEWFEEKRINGELNH